jgi:pyruvate/2-oxoglutarate dehydrogenase complex dihydrolipoamide dehydrogenase (E3) component
MARVKKVIGDLAYHDSAERMKEEFGVDTIRAYARFTGPREVTAGGVVVEANHFVIASGSKPFVPPIEGLEGSDYLTNESVFDQTFQPKHLLVLGGGPIGMEMAQAHCLLGSEVTVVEKGKILGKDDPELVAVVRDRLKADGVEILEGFEAKKVTKKDGVFALTLTTEDGSERNVEGDQLLVAVGRRANVEGLDLEKAGVEYSARGIKVDESLKTTNSRIYAIGDVTGGLQFTHVAGYQGRLAVKNILLKALGGKNETDHVPWVTYTEPELAHVGLTEQQAKDRGFDTTVVRAPFHDNDRANAEGETGGLVKVLIGKDGKILGADVVGSHAGEVVQQFALAVANDLKIGAFDKMIAPYPTLGEISKAAADKWSFAKLFTPLNKAAIKALALFD